MDNAFTGQFGIPNQYTSEQQRIAELLRQAGMEDQLSLQPDQSQAQMIQSGPFSFYAPDSGAGLRALSKGLRGYSANKMRSEAMQANKALGERYQSDLMDTLSKAGSVDLNAPAVPAAPNINPVDDNGTPMPGTAAIPSGRAKMAQILMGHPATQDMAMGQIGKQIESADRQQKLAQALRMASGQQLGGAAPAGGAGGQAANPFAGVPPQVVALMTSGDAELMALGKSLLEANKGVAQRAGAPVVNPFTGAIIAQPTPAVPPGVQLNVGPGGPKASTVPGFPQAQQEIGATPMQEVTNANQTKSYIPKAQLAAAARQPMPGMRVNPAEQAARDDRRFRLLTDELKDNPNDIALKAEYDREVQKRSAAGGIPEFGQTQEEQIRQQRETAGGKSVDEAVGKDLGAFMTGGAQDATRQIAQLGDTLTALKTPGSDLTGPFRGRLPDSVRSVTNPNAIAMRQRVEEVVQRSLRAILGAQFTEKEGERLIARAYDPTQPPAENFIRVQRLYTQLQQALQQKMDLANYFQKNGTMQGWQGKLPTMSDFDVSGARSTGAIGGNSAVEAALRKYGG